MTTHRLMAVGTSGKARYRDLSARRHLCLGVLLAAMAASSCGDNSDHAIATPPDALEYRLTERSWILRSSNGRRIQEPLSGTFQLALSPHSADSRVYGIS